MKTIATYARKLKDAGGNFVAPATRATCVYMSDNTTLEDFVNNLDLRVTGIYPVGSIYQSTDSTSPASMFGGEWEQIQNKFLLGSGSREVESTGGEESHLLLINEIPSHNHNGISTKWQRWASNGPTCGPEGGSNFVVDYNGSFTTNKSGGDQAHNNMPPFFTVNIWRRTA